MKANKKFGAVLIVVALVVIGLLLAGCSQQDKWCSVGDNGAATNTATVVE
jgi:outer membrane murein-binding lipoprotein Lpp